MANLKDTIVLGKLNVTDQIVASKIIKLGGTSDQILLANGDVTTLSNLGAGNVTGSNLTDNTIILGGGGSSIESSSKTIATSVGSDDTTVPTSKAVKDYVTGLGYITGSYLPLAGGTMTGTIQYAGATREIISFAPTDSTWRGGLKYSWSSNTTIGLWGKHKDSQFVWHAGTDFFTTDVNGTTTRTYDFQVGRDVGSGGSGNLEALLGGKPLATQEWVEGKGYVTGSDLTADYIILGNGNSSIKKGNYRITTDIASNDTNAYLPTAEAVDTFVSGKLSGISTSDQKTSSSNQAATKLLIVGAQSASTSGVTTYTNSGCYIGTDNCLYSNGKKVATEEWVETAIKDKISSVTIYSEVLYNASGSLNGSEWTEGWRYDTEHWDPSTKNDNSTASYTIATVTNSNRTITLRRPYSPETTHSRWVMEISASGMHGLSINGVGVTTIANSKYKLQFAATTNQTITLSKGEATFVINIVFNNASYQD